VSDGSLVSPATRARVRAAVVPLVVAMGRLGLTPNALTLIGFGISVLAAIAAANQAWLAAGLLVIGGGVFDLFDGALARAQGKASRLGAFLDSVFDRWGEGVIYLGIVWGTLDLGLWRPVVLAAAAMAAAFMVSYTRAKSESLGFTPGSGMASVGLAPREVRIAILTIGLIVAGLLPGFPEDMDLPGAMAYPLSALALEAALGLITVLATITTIQRVVHVIRQSRYQERGNDQEMDST
jgi:CDP-diacylglycerol--glycerol-3-phosphate 3-phosphatidyltransferase